MGTDVSTPLLNSSTYFYIVESSPGNISDILDLPTSSRVISKPEYEKIKPLNIKPRPSLSHVVCDHSCEERSGLMLEFSRDRWVAGSNLIGGTVLCP